FKAPCCSEIQQFLLKYVPPVLPSLKHAVISSRAAKLLLRKSEINAAVMPDTLDFSMPPWIKDDFNKDFLKTFNLSENDILILQATRIVKRKGIELILPILEKLNDTNYLSQLVGKKIFNGKTITENSKFVFIIAGYAEQEAESYFQSIISYLHKKKIPFRNIQHQISAERENNGNLKKFSIFDTYAYADLVSYPSLYEGWGNQFIEAVFARKPVIAFEYPVFITDIKPKGYEVISLGSKTSFDTKTELLKLPDIIIDETCNKIIETLISKNTTTNLNRNFNIAKSSNSQKTLISLMNSVMEGM
ncbi:MAG: glycosyltransferase, partial [Spirochaetaceae bacterium]|nr:glycosyltransferase [Spirochaetaceae bacterium]